jgi:N-acetylneuraminic acid mutarotase
MKKISTFILLACLASSALADYWTQLASFPAAGRQLASGFSIGSKGYVTCGENGAYLNDLWEYDPALNQWTQLASLPGIGRYGAVTFVINGKGYIGTGAYPLMDDLWEYDPVSNSWAQKASITGARGFAAGFAIGLKGYIGCGMGVSDFWEWDQPSNTWTQKSTCPVNRVQAVGFAVMGKGYFSTGSNMNDLWEYDPFTNAWVQKANLPGPGRVDATAFVICDRGYLGSGGDGPLMNDFYEYNPVLDQWLQKSNTPGGLRDDCPSFSIGMKGYFGLGDNGVYQNDFWEYTPDACVTVPPAAAFTAPNHICPGTCTSFNNVSTNALTYQWIFTGATPSYSVDQNPTGICYNTPGVYPVTLIATNAAGDDTLTLNNYITVYPYPAPQAISQSGDTLFANTGATSYQWYYGGNIITGATDYFYVAAQSGNYNVVATDNNDCEVEAVIFDVFANIYSLSDNVLSVAYPNPATDEIGFSSEVMDEASEVSIFNTAGEKVLTAKPQTSSGLQRLAVNISDLRPAVYFLQISNREKTYRTRFVKSSAQ